jgi:carboxypeptidase C (cathepsin A)
MSGLHRFSVTLFVLLLVASTCPPPGLHAAGEEPKRHDAKEATDAPGKRSASQPSVTHHTLEIKGESLRYRATAGYLPLTNEKGELQSKIFYVAYEKEEADAKGRPVTFCFNGGPGAASAWLHMGALGPKRTVFPEGGKVLPEKPELTDNQHTWLPFTDLVFIDPVGTAFSHAAEGVDPKQFWNVEGDLKSVGEFIRSYVAENGRWLSPLFLAGESYGATRAGGLSSHLQDTHDINLDGIMLISSVLNFQNIVFAPNHDLPYVLFLPTMTACAWYHGKLPPDLQRMELPEVLKRAGRWANTEYVSALTRGNSLSGAEMESTANALALYSGLPQGDILSHDLRITHRFFAKNLLTDRKIGIKDGRVKGISLHPPMPHYGRYDPSLYLTKGPLRATILHYLRTELDWTSNRRYHLLSDRVHGAWDWQQTMGYPNVMSSLRKAMTRNPHMQVVLACGYYDLTTPYHASEWMVRHLDLDPELRDNISIRYYRAGHQMYTHFPALEKLTRDAAALIK